MIRGPEEGEGGWLFRGKPCRPQEQQVQRPWGDCLARWSESREAGAGVAWEGRGGEEVVGGSLRGAFPLRGESSEGRSELGRQDRT